MPIANKAHNTKPSHTDRVHVAAPWPVHYPWRPQQKPLPSRPARSRTSVSFYPRLAPISHPPHAFALHRTAIKATPPPAAATTSTTRRFPLLRLSILIVMTVAGSMLLLARGARGSTVAAAALRGGVASCFVPASSSTNQSVRLPVRPLRVRTRVVFMCSEEQGSD